MITYQKMTRDELNTCALLAAEAFYDYEYFSIYISDDKRRKRFLYALIKCEFRANWKNTETAFFTAREKGRVAAVAQFMFTGFQKTVGYGIY